VAMPTGYSETRLNWPNSCLQGRPAGRRPAKRRSSQPDVPERSFAWRMPEPPTSDGSASKPREAVRLDPRPGGPVICSAWNTPYETDRNPREQLPKSSV
jgi:hypothetical protein